MYGVYNRRDGGGKRIILRSSGTKCRSAESVCRVRCRIALCRDDDYARPSRPAAAIGGNRDRNITLLRARRGPGSREVACGTRKQKKKKKKKSKNKITEKKIKYLLNRMRRSPHEFGTDSRAPLAEKGAATTTAAVRFTRVYSCPPHFSGLNPSIWRACVPVRVSPSLRTVQRLIRSSSSSSSV